MTSSTETVGGGGDAASGSVMASESETYQSNRIAPRKIGEIEISMLYFIRRMCAVIVHGDLTHTHTQNGD